MSLNWWTLFLTLLTLWSADPCTGFQHLKGRTYFQVNVSPPVLPASPSSLNKPDALCGPLFFRNWTAILSKALKSVLQIVPSFCEAQKEEENSETGRRGWALFQQRDEACAGEVWGLSSCSFCTHFMFDQNNLQSVWGGSGAHFMPGNSNSSQYFPSIHLPKCSKLLVLH